MKPTFLTREQLGRVTKGQFNPRWRPAVQDIKGRVHIALASERTHDAIRTRHAITAGTDGYTYLA